jgi:hypothetical protein
MKLFEYAAAGLTVAATHSFRPGNVSLPTLCRAGSADAFARTVGRAFELAADAAGLATAREIARAQDWDAKAAELLRLVQQARAEQPLPGAVRADLPLLPVRNSWS